MSINKNLVISIKGCKDQLDCKNKFQIHEDSVIELKGEFRSAGKTKSKIYFGLKCFKEDGTEISREDINRVDEPILITSINTDNKSLFLHKKPEKWNNQNDSYSERYSKLIGFYFDGNINHVPDYSLKYKNYENNLIHLISEIPKEILDKIIPYQSKVMNQEMAALLIIVLHVEKLFRNNGKNIKLNMKGSAPDMEIYKGNLD